MSKYQIERKRAKNNLLSIIGNRKIDFSGVCKAAKKYRTLEAYWYKTALEGGLSDSLM